MKESLMNASNEAVWKEAAERIGFTPQPRLPLHLQITAETASGPSRRPGTLGRVEDTGEYEVSQVAQRRLRGGTFTLCTLQRKRVVAKPLDSHFLEIRRQTLLIFTARKACFPTAEIQPDTSGLSARHRLFEFPDDSDFQKRFSSATPVPEAVRPLLTPQVREVLKANRDLGVWFHGRNIIVYVPGHASRWHEPTPLDEVLARRDAKRVFNSQTIHPKYWPEFLKAGAGIINAIRKAENETRSHRPAPPEIDLREAYYDGPGWGILPRETIDAFLEQAPPRRIPPAILRATRSRTIPEFRFLGCFLLILASLVFGMLWLAGYPGSLVLPGLIMGTIDLVGAGLLLFPIWRQWRHVRLLKHGRAVPGKIVRVEQIGMRLRMGGHVKYPRYDATLAYEVDGEAYQTDVVTYCDQSKRAAMLWESGGETRILVSRRSPWRVFWIGGLVLE